ncbi:FGGY family carbohydrate kinase [Microbacterium lushaniae]|uniref:Autoinducer-2 kinase n=1 Tax=Microbacterium lushaniae TaxID=2614639 RepID=A0A5J6L135_9MICO|nr:FGGY family carbohydrate kinase [Microbacterium lushaniae]QEW02142.1 autoinducer-2 kinase [Microbacterium lushaniae]
MSDVFLAIDAGTGSARALAFDIEGRLVAQAGREWSHATVPGHPGGTTFDTSAGWRAIGDAVSEVVAHLDGRRIAAIAASSMREGFVLYGADGDELWACPNTDGRSRAEADELVALGIADAIYRTAGDWVSITAPARLRWIARHEPDVLARARHLGMLSDWVTRRLTGAFVTDPTCGSSSALFDLRAREWSADLADLVGVDRAILPPVVECGAVVGVVTPTAAAATGVPAGTPVVTGGADTQLALHGIDAREGTPTIVAGTFWQTAAVMSEPLIDPDRRLRTLCHVEQDTWMLEGIGFLSGLAMRWFRDAMCPDAVSTGAATGRSAFSVMEEWAADVPPGANGIVATMGNVMQADAWHHAAPSFTGFDINDAVRSSRGAFIRAIEESAAIVAAAHLDILSALTEGRAVAQGVVTFTGGSSAGALWPAVIAGVTGLETLVTPAPEATSYGAARLAAKGVGASLPPMGEPDRVVRVDPEERDAYGDVVARWHRVYRDVLSISGPDLPPLFLPPGAARGPAEFRRTSAGNLS